MGFWQDAGNAIVNGASGLIGGLFGLKNTDDVNKANIQAVRETNKANRELAQYNWEQQRQMWNEKNAYDSPIQQMARLKEAGLNPNLVYGSIGNMSGQAPTPAMPTQEAPHAERSDYGFIAQSANSAVQTYMQQQQLDSQLSLNASQKSAAEAQAINYAADTTKKLADAAKTDQDREQASEIFRFTLRAQELGLTKMQNEIKGQENELSIFQLRVEERRLTNMLLEKKIDISKAEAEKISMESLKIAQEIISLRKDLEVKQSVINSNNANARLTNSNATFQEDSYADRLEKIAADVALAKATGDFKSLEAKWRKDYGFSDDQVTQIANSMGYHITRAGQWIFGLFQ